MNPKVCVICRNSKPVNQTDNRLVTEDCGHVKCMGCLLLEKSGCVACLREGSDQESGEGQTEVKEISKKKKPETSHVRIVTVGNEKFYECTVCKKRFHARSQVAYHAYCNGQRKPYQCPECNKSFATHSHFKYHMRVHRNERTYACEVCGDSFFQMSKLQRHKLKHTKEKKYACTECNKGFNNLTSLRKHGLTHTEERPYQCNACSRRFRDGSNYRKHVAKHEMNPKSTCSGFGRSTTCGAGGGNNSVSRAIRPHQCPRCPQAFHSGKDMRRHAAVHSDSKPFRCKVCNRRFRRKDNLERHIRNTHPEYVPATAVECDEGALKQLVDTNGQSDRQADTKGVNEKSKMEIIEIKKSNPLPPLTQEVIQKHMYEGEIDLKKETKPSKEEVIDKSYILEANNARQSVIVEKRNTESEKKAASPAPEYNYVHKIRRANLMHNPRDVPLPPIDEQKMLKLKENSDLNEFHSRPPLKNVELYKLILSTNDKQVLSQVSPNANTEA